MATSYRQLIVWQKSVELVKIVYRVTRSFPKEELFGLVSQIRRAAVSIPSNIAEGYGRRSDKEYLQFYSFSYGSALELETQLFIAQKLEFGEKNLFRTAESLLNEVIKMLYVMVYKRKEGNIVKSKE